MFNVFVLPQLVRVCMAANNLTLKLFEGSKITNICLVYLVG